MRRCLHIVVIELVLLGVAQSAAGATWTRQYLPRYPHVLLGLSCPAARVCVGAGISRRHGEQLTLADRWDGTSWSIESTPEPPAANYGRLNGVSCASQSWCVAVGIWQAAGGTGPPKTLAERWNGTRWWPQTLLAPPTGGEPDSVSCFSRTACTALGRYVNGYENGNPTQALFAERWNGTDWTVEYLPSPPEAVGAVSDGGVSCSSATSCTVVGTYYTGSQNRTLAERWNGRGWLIQTTVDPSARVNVLKSVSCSQPWACTAVGQYEDHGVWATLAERWNGHSWSLQPTPRHPTPESTTASTYPELTSVSCPATNWCLAAGYSQQGTGRNATGQPLAEVWTGHQWVVQNSPFPRNATDGGLGPVSCSAVATCTLLGGYINTTDDRSIWLAERYS